MKRTLLLLLTVAMMAAACSGSDDPAAVTEDVVSELDVDTEAAGETASEAAGEVVGAIDEAGCQAAAEALQDLPMAVADIAAGQGDMAAIQSQIGAFDQVAESAPADVAADFDVIASTFDEVEATLSGMDMESGTAPGAEAQAAISELASTMTSEEFTSAAANVSTYFAEGCPAS